MLIDLNCSLLDLSRIIPRSGVAFTMGIFYVKALAGLLLRLRPLAKKLTVFLLFAVQTKENEGQHKTIKSGSRVATYIRVYKLGSVLQNSIHAPIIIGPPLEGSGSPLESVGPLKGNSRFFGSSKPYSWRPPRLGGGTKAESTSWTLQVLYCFQGIRLLDRNIVQRKTQQTNVPP